MRKESVLVLAVAMTAVCCLVGYPSARAAAAQSKIKLRVLYVGHPNTPRESDFVEFLEKHFTKAGKGDLDKFKEKDAENYDVVILDYSGLTIKGNAIVMPRVPVDASYSHPTITTSAAGALVCDHLNLKTGYL